jgi:LPXTG-motif cell wall-anchored protein
VLKAVVGKDGSVVTFKVTNERIPGEPVQPEGPEIPAEKPPKTGDSNTIVTVALVLLILAGGVVLWLRKRGKAEEEPTEAEKA